MGSAHTLMSLSVEWSLHFIYSVYQKWYIQKQRKWDLSLTSPLFICIGKVSILSLKNLDYKMYNQFVIYFGCLILYKSIRWLEKNVVSDYSRYTLLFRKPAFIATNVVECVAAISGVSTNQVKSSCLSNYND